MIKLLEGDCLERMSEIEDESIDMILCDLPYGVTKNKWDSVLPLNILWREYNRITKERGVVCLCATGLFLNKLISSNEKYFKYDLIWEKDRPSGHLNAKRQPLRNHESLLLFYKKQPTYNPIMSEGKASHSVGRAVNNKKCKNNNYGIFKSMERKGTLKYPKSFLGTFKRPHPPIHPTQKPVELFEYLIKTYTNEGDLVLDNCAGSGTTGVACKNLNRNCIMIERESKYCDMIRNRMNST